MKKLLSITCVMLLAVGIAVAQDTPPSGEQPAQPAPQEQPQQEQQPQSDQAATTIRGCLSGSDNNFTISDQSGQTYKLSGDFTMLSQHVNHEVELTGKIGEVSGAADPSAGEAGAATTGDQKVFEFTNVTMISETCSAGSGTTPESSAAATQPQAEAPAAQTQPDMSAQSTPPATTTPDTSAQTTPPATTTPEAPAQPDPSAAQPEAPAQEEAAQQPAQEPPAEQPATEEQPAAAEAQDQAAADEQLPQTATPLPLLALLGLGSLAAGLWARRK